MRTLDLDVNYDLHIVNGNIAIQRDDLETIKQNIVNRLSLVKNEDIYNDNNGLNINIMFGENFSYSEKIAEIKRVIYLDTNVIDIEKVTMEADNKTRVGYFTCYIVVKINGKEEKTNISFGV